MKADSAFIYSLLKLSKCLHKQESLQMNGYLFIKLSSCHCRTHLKYFLLMEIFVMKAAKAGNV